MLSRARTARLCHACNRDLLFSLERRFCSSASLRRFPPPARPQLRDTPVSSHYILRAYSAAARRLQHEAQHVKHEHDDSVPLSEPSDNRYARLERLAEIERKLDELHSRLFDSVKEAVDSVHSPGLASQESPTPPDLRDILVSRAQEVVAGLRGSGASQEDIVREARQIFGEILPDDILNDKEFKIYTRLYGDPIPEEELFEDEVEDDLVEAGTTSLLNQDGELVEFDALGEELIDANDLGEDFDVDEAPRGKSIVFQNLDMPLSSMVSHSESIHHIAKTLNGQVVEEDALDEDEEDHDQEGTPRTHPFTAIGKFANNPGSIQIPMDRFVRPVEEILGGFSNKQLKEISHKTFGGPGVPDSALTPTSGRSRKQVPIPLSAFDHNMGEMEANSFLATVMTPTYASITSVLVETRRRLGPTWLNNLLAREGGPRVLDAGSGGAGIFAWREIIQAHWDTLHSSDLSPPPLPPTKSVVLTGSHTLRHRAAQLLDDTTFIPRLPDYVHLRDAPTLEDSRPASQRKQFDIIIASHALFQLSQDFAKKELVQNLWSMLSSDGGILIIIEKGIPRGFEAVAGARELLLEKYIAVPEGTKTHYSNAVQDDDPAARKTGMIVAPCTNHEQCPMYLIPGKSEGRKDHCKFKQRFIRPNYLQRIIEAKERNHDDVEFSYVSVMKGEDLRQRKISSWQDIEDPLSSAVQTESRDESEDSRAALKDWLRTVQAGFEDIEPETTLEQLKAADAERGSLTSLPGPWNLPRLILPALKRKQHILMDVCTPHAKIERWIVPKSFGNQAYRDARKSQWGDLWALGAKTRILRKVNPGAMDNKKIQKQARRSRAATRRKELKDGTLDNELDQFSAGDGHHEQHADHQQQLKRNSLPPKEDTKKAVGNLAAPANNVDSFTLDHSAARAIDPTVWSQASSVKEPRAPIRKKGSDKKAGVDLQEKMGSFSRLTSRSDRHNEPLTRDEESYITEWEDEFKPKPQRRSKKAMNDSKPFKPRDQRRMNPRQKHGR